MGEKQGRLGTKADKDRRSFVLGCGTVGLKHINEEIGKYLDFVRADYAEATSRPDGNGIGVARKITDIARELFEKAFCQPLAKSAQACVGSATMVGPIPEAYFGPNLSD
jgi:hypothetical protein